jgi:hypothetical protein
MRRKDTTTFESAKHFSKKTYFFFNLFFHYTKNI